MWEQLRIVLLIDKNVTYSIYCMHSEWATLHFCNDSFTVILSFQAPFAQSDVQYTDNCAVVANLHR